MPEAKTLPTKVLPDTQPFTLADLISQIKETPVPFAVMMVGLPGTGKTTFVNRLRAEIDVVVISTDDLIEGFAKEQGTTYDKAFYSLDRNELAKQALDKQKEAIANGKNVVIDQTNVGEKTRRRKLGAFRKAKYRQIAVECTARKSDIEWRQILRSEEGKTIPASVMQTMISGYQRPQASEGFTSIFTIES